MTKEQLTPEKLGYIEAISYQLKCTQNDMESISAQLPERITNADNCVRGPIALYDQLIQRHNVGDLYETFRLLLFARLQRNAQELKSRLLEQINEK